MVEENTHAIIDVSVGMEAFAFVRGIVRAKLASSCSGLFALTLLGTATPPAEAQQRTSFDAWHIQFDPSRLEPYDERDQQRALDSFAKQPALDAKLKGEADYMALIPPDVRRRMQEEEQDPELHELEQVSL